MTSSALVKLSEAARRLGCHVETLRIRVRKGQLKAVRGPHGAYYIPQRAVLSLLTIRRWRPRVLLTPSLQARSWALVERELTDQELALLRAVARDPSRNKSLYRLASVHRLVALGLGFDQIGEELGISARHARRLDMKRLRPALASARMREKGRKQQLADARQVVVALRTELEASGFQRHTIVRPRPSGTLEPTTAFTIKKLTRDEIQGLRAAGLTEEQIQAVSQVGIGTDELNALLVRGTDRRLAPRQSRAPAAGLATTRRSGP